jgi:hypothetical protein
MRIKKIYKLIAIVFAGLIIQAVLPSIAFAVYVSSGTITSTNLLSGSSASSITNFHYNISSKPGNSSVTVQFSTTSTAWYSSAGVLNGSDTLTTTGGADLSLTGMNVSGSTFYYKITLNSTSDNTQTPAVDDIRLDYNLASGYDDMFAVNNTGNVGIGSSGTSNAAGSKLSVLGGGTIGSDYFTNIAPTNGLLVQGNVGLGTTTPYAKLSIWGDDALSTSRLFELTNSASTTLASFQNNGTGYLAGNIGIGSSTPWQKLGVSGNVDANAYFMNGLAFATSSPTLNNYYLFTGSTTPTYNTTSQGNIGIGPLSLSNLTAPGSGSYGANTAIGYWAMASTTTGYSNVALGYKTLQNNTTGNNNIAIGGYLTMGSSPVVNFTGSQNIAIGSLALYKSDDGLNNVAVGVDALGEMAYSPNDNNTAVGAYAGGHNDRGSNNSFFGFNSGWGSGDYGISSNNSAFGYQSLYNTHDASYGSAASNNIAFGYQAGYSLINGSYNILLGSNVDATSTSAVGELNIGNVLFGTGMYGGATMSNTPTGNGMIGIGTTSPYSVLSISNSATTAVNTPLFTIASTTGGLSTTTLMTVLANGNVGIGTANPGSNLQVAGSFEAGDRTAFGNAFYIGSNSTVQTGLVISGGDYNNVTIYIPSPKALNILDQGSRSIASFDTNTGDVLLGYNPNNSWSRNFTIKGNGNVGIGTTSPYSKLSVWGADTLSGNRLFELTNSASTSLAYFDNAGNVNFPVATATTTIAGGLNVGNGSIVYDWNTGTTSLSYVEMGNMNFAPDSGNIGWVDLAVTAASAAGVQNSYTANLNGNPMITVSGISNGAGSLSSMGVGIGTTTPWAMLAVAGTTTGAFSNAFVVSDVASTTRFVIQDAGNVGIGTTTPGSIFSIQSGATGIANFDVSTSTIYNNINILGTGHATTWYTGDLFFANNWSFSEAPINASSTQGLLLRNQGGKDMFTIDENGNLSLVGDVCYQGKQCFGKSLNGLESDLNALASTTSNSLFSIQATTTASLSELTVSLGHIEQGLFDINARIDAIASSTTASAFSGMIVSELTSSSTAMGLLASSTANILLASEVTPTENASSTPSFIERVANAISEYIQNTAGWVFAKITSTLAIFNRVETQTASVSNGLEMTDSVTGTIYCVRITNGEFAKTPGACATAPVATSTPDVGHPETPSPTPSIAPSITPTISPTPTPTSTPTVGSGGETSPTVTPTPSVSPAESSTPTPSVTPVESSTPTPSVPGGDTSSPAPVESAAPASSPAGDAGGDTSVTP